MRWQPQPKPPCERPDCDKPSRQYGYCPNHAALLDRNGTPYTQEEVAGMRPWLNSVACKSWRTTNARST